MPSNPLHKVSRFLIKVWLVGLILVGIWSLFIRAPGDWLVFILAGFLFLVLWLDQIPSAWGGRLLLLIGACGLIWVVITSFDPSGSQNTAKLILNGSIFYLPPFLLGAGLLLGQARTVA